MTPRPIVLFARLLFLGGCLVDWGCRDSRALATPPDAVEDAVAQTGSAPVASGENAPPVVVAEDASAEDAGEAAVSERQLMFASCEDLWTRGKPRPKAKRGLARTPGRLRVVPLPGCADPPGWAGKLLWSSMQYLAFTADGRLVDGCDLRQAGTGKLLGNVCGDDISIDGTPLAEMPAMKRKFRALGVPAREGRWADDDVYVRWSLAQDTGVSFELRRDDGDAAVAIASFPGDWSMPLGVHVSPDGKWLAR